MPKYVRWVSVYTGPALYATLKDEYLTAVHRLGTGDNTVINRDEDIKADHAYIRHLQLHSHLSIKVVVNKQDLPRNQIRSIAASTLMGCLTTWHPQMDYYRYFRDYIASLGPPWEQEVLSPKEEFNHVIQFEPLHHPMFEWEDKPVTPLERERWTPGEIEWQYKTFPKLCGEDSCSKEARRRRHEKYGSTTVIFSRNIIGDVEIVTSKNGKIDKFIPVKQKPTCSHRKVNY